MTVKELIQELIEYGLDYEVCISIEKGGDYPNYGSLSEVKRYGDVYSFTRYKQVILISNGVIETISGNNKEIEELKEKLALANNDIQQLHDDLGSLAWNTI